MQEYDVTPNQVWTKKNRYTQTATDTLYMEAEHIVKNYKKIDEYWRSVQRKSVAICAFSVGVLFATVLYWKKD